MKVALLRVGIDSGSGGMQGPLFRDGTFEYVPIPDVFGQAREFYGNTRGSHGRALSEYFPPSRHERMAQTPIHIDPEFVTFTYGDPSASKAGLRHLTKGDLLVIYCGLEGWGFESPPALYLLGYFEVAKAGPASGFSAGEIVADFSSNFHVRYRDGLLDQWSRLVLVKGGSGSRLLKTAVRVSSIARDRDGRPLKVISPEMREVFGDLRGRLSLQRSPTRWVEPGFVGPAADLVRSLA